MFKRKAAALQGWTRLGGCLFVLTIGFSQAGMVQAATSLLPAGSMAVKRFSHPTETLLDGRVLVAGGATAWDANDHEIYTNTAEIYNPATNSWSSAGTFPVARRAHFFLRLASGKILMIGGETGFDLANDHALWTNTAVLYNPATNSWSSAGSMSHPHVYGAAIELGNGKVLVMGGAATEKPAAVPTNKFDLYDPATNNWSSGVMTMARSDIMCYRVFLLSSNGKVLVVGGRTGYDAGAGRPIHTATTEIYNPATNSWSSAGSMSGPHIYSRGFLLNNGKVLIAGGLGNTGVATTLADRYDPVSNTWSPAGSMAHPHYLQHPLPLADGRLLIVGGKIETVPYAVSTMQAEIYSPATNTWSVAGTMTHPHNYTWPILLANGKVLIAGGMDDLFATTAAAELYDPVTNHWSAAGNMANKRMGGFVTAVPGGKGMVLGGNLDETMSATKAADLYDPVLNSWSVAQLSEPKYILFSVTPFGTDGLLISGGLGIDQTVYSSADKVVGSATPVTCGAPGSITVPLADTDGGYTVSWGASATAGVTYQLQEATSSTFTAGLRTAYSGTARTINITGRSQNVTYYYRVRATKAGNTASAWRTAVSGCAVPGTATAGVPASITVPVADADGAYTVSWGASATVGASYELQEATACNFSTGLRTAYRGTARTINITGRSQNLTYYYRVRAVKGGLKDSGYRYGAFGCAVPGTSVERTPASITVPVSDTDGTYSMGWSPVRLVAVAEQATAVVSYVVEEATTPTFDKGWRIAYNGPNTTLPITGRPVGQTYYYRVKQVKAGSRDSEYRYGNNGCAVPGASTTAMPSSITVPASDPDGAYAVSWSASVTAGVTYFLQEATNSGFTTDLRTAYFGTSTSTNIAGRPKGKTYYYRVQAVKPGLVDGTRKVATNGCVVGP